MLDANLQEIKKQARLQKKEPKQSHPSEKELESPDKSTIADSQSNNIRNLLGDKNAENLISSGGSTHSGEISTSSDFESFFEQHDKSDDDDY